VDVGAAALPSVTNSATVASAQDPSGNRVTDVPAMVDAATALVRARGVESRDIHADAFFPAANSSKQMAEAR